MNAEVCACCVNGIRVVFLVMCEQCYRGLANDEYVDLKEYDVTLLSICPRLIRV